MRICLVGPAYPYRGGIAHFTAMLSREFGKHNDVRIVGFNRLYPAFLFPGRTQYDESDSPLRVESDRLIDSIAPWTYLRAARRVTGFAPDVVVFQWWQPFFAPAFRTMCWWLRRKTSARIVFVCHNVLPHESSMIDRSLTRLGLGGAHAFVVQSREDGERLRELMPNARFAFNPLPVFDLFNRSRHTRESARETIGVDGRVLLFFGLIRRYKGLDILLRAFARCADRIDATLLVVGEFYEDRRPYDRMLDDLRIRSRVRVVDSYVPDEEVEAYFRAADVAVLPYRSATQSAIVQTAFSFEKPVIVTAVGGLPDVVDDGRTGFVVPPEDPEALADAIERFFAESRSAEMERNIAAAADRFSWRRCTEVLLATAGEID